MPSFLRVFRRDTATKSKKNANASNAVEAPKPKWEEAWSRTEVQPEEVQELIHVCTQEMKSRGMYILSGDGASRMLIAAQPWICPSYFSPFGQALKQLGPKISYGNISRLDMKLT